MADILSVGVALKQENPNAHRFRKINARGGRIDQPAARRCPKFVASVIPMFNFIQMHTMKSIYTSVARFLSDEQGATAIEYGLLVALISLVIVVGAAAVGTNLNALFTKISTCLATPTAAACKFP